jgi:MoaA/NifB/PqqE/SkfB family radical SAM enzyme
VWQDLKNWAPGIEFYELYGAEPMLIDPLWEVIKVSSQSTNGRNTVVNINTNGTILRDDTEDIFKKFFKVVLNLSVDGINDQFEYLRYPAKWDKFLSNLDAYQHLAAVWRNISISVSCTVSALNIYYTDEIWKFFHDRDIHVGFNILHRPDHLNMRILPDAVKQQISDKLRSTGTPAQNLIDMLNSPIQNSEKHLLDFWVFTEGYDDLRGESYAETFPEMFNILANSR